MNAQKKKKLTQIFIPTLRIAARTTGTGGFGATAWGIFGAVVFWGKKSKAAAK
jgi:hypothetical protein